MKSLSKLSKIQGIETRTRKCTIIEANLMASRPTIPQGVTGILSTSNSTKNKVYLDQKSFSRSAAKPYIAQTETPKTGEEAWFLKSIRKLQKLENLPANWDSYGANPPNSIALFWGRESLTVLFEMNFPPTQITPSVEEGIGICFIRGKKYADIECFNTGEILAVTSDGQGNPNVWEVNPSGEELKNSLERIRVYLQS
ncbi:hypothetical protein [Argonema antarcticum]|uniref:hypothetical protein n=2 Tax=Argonema antarcticum TaxID=2942763 RepID=UPI00201153CE|nr:hypothetical protein [Argonema antarcticum]MCL1470644.1 hypothetical protein [Argonema antarcticum A004/B2]